MNNCEKYGHYCPNCDNSFTPEAALRATVERLTRENAELTRALDSQRDFSCRVADLLRGVTPAENLTLDVLAERIATLTASLAERDETIKRLHADVSRWRQSEFEHSHENKRLLASGDPQ